MTTQYILTGQKLALIYFFLVKLHQFGNVDSTFYEKKNTDICALILFCILVKFKQRTQGAQQGLFPIFCVQFQVWICLNC